MSSTDAQSALTVLLVDDHAIVREGYKRLLEGDELITVIGEADNGEMALENFRRLNPDVVVMDVTLPAESGIETLRRMRRERRASRILMFSMHEDPVFAKRSLQAGALGYVTKVSAPHVLVDAVRAVASGSRYLSSDISQELALRGAANAVPRIDLSDRELEVLRLLINGLKLQQVADRLQLTAKTVANIQSIIRQKLRAETPVQFVHIGARILRELGKPTR